MRIIGNQRSGFTGLSDDEALSHQIDGSDAAERRDHDDPSEVQQQDRGDRCQRQHPHDSHEVGEGQERERKVLECRRKE